MNVKQLCLDLIYCEKEADVIKMLDKHHLWNDNRAWRLYGNNENNFAIVGNQQSKPESAIVEKLINSVDAVLIAECMKRGINPECMHAPQSIGSALSQFFSIREGKLSNLTPTERSKLAKNICLVASGSKTKPCYSIIDKGEGQTPARMPATFLSLSESNKLRIPFVQGKFNQGGTGVFQFCGMHNIQLVLSRRDTEIAKQESDETKKYWGFTIVRRQNPSEGRRSSTYHYLAPCGKILMFESNSLPLLPQIYPEPYGGELEWGTYIKLYEYEMTGLKTNMLFDLYNRLSLLMPTIALPIRLYERRKGYVGHSFETTLSGLTVRLDEDRRDNLEEGFPTSGSLSACGQKMKVSIYAFKRGQSEKYARGEGVIFSINGQTHAYLPRSFFTRKTIRMGYLADSMLVIVDCSALDYRAIEDLFMNSRDRLRTGDLKAEIESNLEDLLKNHPGLKTLRERRKREDIENKIGDSQPLVDVIERILKTSPTLSKLFLSGHRLPNPFNVVKKGKKQEYTSKRFPTFFMLKEEYPADNPKLCPINRRFRIQYKTDAPNDYFDRDCEPGIFSLIVNGEETRDYSLNLWNGSANLNVQIPAAAKVGEVLWFKSIVSDVAKVDDFVCEFYIKTERQAKKYKSTPGKRKPPASDEEGEDSEGLSHLALPEIIPVRRDQWNKYTFNEETALVVKDSGDSGYYYFVNMDNIHLRTEQKGNAKIDPRLLEVRYKFGMVLIGIALLQDYERREDDKQTEDNENNIFQKITYVTRVISPILLPMITSLGDLHIDEETVE